MKLISKNFLLIIALIFVSATCFADGPPEPPKGPPGPPVPIDNNILILLFFALVLGIYKIYQFKKYKKTPN